MIIDFATNMEVVAILHRSYNNSNVCLQYFSDLVNGIRKYIKDLATFSFVFRIYLFSQNIYQIIT